MSPVSPAKAKKILRDKSVRGHPLTGKQRRFFGFIAGGGRPTKIPKTYKGRQARSRARAHGAE